MQPNAAWPIDPNVVVQAALEAAEIMTGMGYHGQHGSIHLLDLNLQRNTVTAIFHNLVAWRIGQLDPRWRFHPKGGATPDLSLEDGRGIQIKTTSNAKIKGNLVSRNEGYYVAIKYELKRTPLRRVVVKEILMGELRQEDWERRVGTQWAFLKKDAEARMRRVYPSEA